MSKRNRVTPFGEIIATPERGTLMGNRGILHDAEGHIRRNWALKRWIVCVLEFRGRNRTVMTPNRYTELFFLDEATALAAGHRPLPSAVTPDSSISAWPGKRRIRELTSHDGPAPMRWMIACTANAWLPTAPNNPIPDGWKTCPTASS